MLNGDPRRRAVGRVLVPAVAVLALGACSAPSSGPVGTGPVAVAPVDRSGATDVPSTELPGSGAGSVGSFPVLASRTAPELPDGAGGRITVRVDVNELRVTGSVMQLTVTANNENPALERGDWWQVSDYFADGVAQAGNVSGANVEDTWSVDGIYLADPAASRRYLPGRVGTAACVCSTDLSGRFVNPGTGTLLTATFAAPPPGVDVLDVFVPGAGLFTGVPVARQAPPAPDSREILAVGGPSDTPLRVAVDEVAVSGDQMRVTFTTRNLDEAPEQRSIGWQVASLFWDGIFQDGEGTGGGSNNVDGVKVIDTGNRQRYLPGRTAGGDCACSTNLSEVFVEPGGGVRLSALFAAPPADVGAVDVVVPYAGTFADVPVTRGAATAPAEDADVQVIAPPDDRITELPVQDITFPEASADGAVTDGGDGTFRLSSDVLFDFDRSDLTGRAGDELARIADQLRAAGATTVHVDGYTDDIGEDAYNVELSRARAEAVRGALATVLGSGVDIRATGRGESAPIADNATAEGQALNRRVEIRVG